MPGLQFGNAARVDIKSGGLDLARQRGGQRAGYLWPKPVNTVLAVFMMIRMSSQIEKLRI